MQEIEMAYFFMSQLVFFAYQLFLFSKRGLVVRGTFGADEATYGMYRPMQLMPAPFLFQGEYPFC